MVHCRYVDREKTSLSVLKTYIYFAVSPLNGPARVCLKKEKDVGKTE